MSTSISHPPASRREAFRVLLLGGHQPLIKALDQGLQEEGFAVDVAFVEDLRHEPYEFAEYGAVVCDLVRPETDGLALLERWRAAGLEAHVLVLTVRNSLSGLLPDPFSVVDDWLTKPFSLDELLFRLRLLAGQPARARSVRTASGRSGLAQAAGRQGPSRLVLPPLASEGYVRTGGGGLP